MHTPKHNSVVTDDMHELMTPTSLRASQYSPLGELRKSLLIKVAGSTSRFINEQKEFFAKINGGTLSGVLQNDYQKDYVAEMRMKD